MVDESPYGSPAPAGLALTVRRHYSVYLVQGSKFTVSRFALFSIAIILCIAEYISLTEHTGNTEKKYLIIFLNFVISVISACPVKCEAYLTGVRYNLSLSDNTFSESISVPVAEPRYLSSEGGIQSSSLLNREPWTSEPWTVNLLANACPVPEVSLSFPRWCRPQGQSS